jgi:adenylate/nucleoside-diphosphate kinase
VYNPQLIKVQTRQQIISYDTNWFCPVALKENFVLYPGNPEVASKYREKTYYFSTNEARDKFLANPDIV